MRDYDKIHLKNLIRANDLRRHMTRAELKLWYKLRRSNLGARFRQQHAVDNYILDFVSLEHCLGIRVDGATHWSEEDIAYDHARTLRLNELGFRLIRFTNQQIYTSMELVLTEIAGHINRA